MFWCLPKMFFIASFIGTRWMWSSDSWREAEETQESHLDSRPVSDPEWPFYNLLQSQQVQSTVCSCTVLILQSTVSTGPQCPQCLPQCPQCPIHSVDSTNYSLNRSSLQSGLVQLSRTVLFIRSSRVKEVWLACCWNAHRIKARKTSLDNHWQTRRDNRLCKVKITQMKDVELQWLLYVVHCKLCWQ